MAYSGAEVYTPNDMVRKSGQSFRGRNELQEVVGRGRNELQEVAAHARNVDLRWAEIPREVEEASRRAAEAGQRLTRARSRRTRILFEARRAEGAWHAHQESLAQLASAVQEVATEAEGARLAEEVAAEREQVRRLEQLRRVEEDARAAEARRRRLIHESEQLEDAARDAAVVAAKARQAEEAARAERMRRVHEAQAAHEAVVAAHDRAVEAVQRANRIARLAAAVAQRKQEAYEQEKVRVARLARHVLEARRAQVLAVNAQARRLSIAREREEVLHRLEASGYIEHAPGSRRRPAAESSTPPPRTGRGFGLIEGGQVQGGTTDVTVLFPGGRASHPGRSAGAQLAPHRSAPRGPLKPWIVPLVTLAVVLAALFSLLMFLPGEEVRRPSPSPDRRAPAEERGLGARRVVPEVSGRSISEARERLLEADLRFRRVKPTPGPPGTVVGAYPVSGRVLPAGTAVTLYVGVDPRRLEWELGRTRTEQAPSERRPRFRAGTSSSAGPIPAGVIASGRFGGYEQFGGYARVD